MKEFATEVSLFNKVSRMLVSRMVASLRRDESGMSAVEFAMLLPLMLTLYLGTVEVSQGVAIDRKVTLTARTVADLASQVTSINNTDMTNILNAASAIVTPFGTTQLKVTVSAVSIDKDGVAKVAWSDTLHGTKRGVGTTVTVPEALNVRNSQLIWGEASYHYVPTVGYVLTGPLDLSDQIYMRPRLSETINRVNS